MNKTKFSVFSVSPSRTVKFAPGNLQYTQSTKTWAFAANQYDMIGTDNVTGGEVSSDATMGYLKSGSALATKIDLFGWSAKNTTAPWGISTSTDRKNDYLGDFVDWGKNIGNGTTWCTLTKAEWDYLLKDRTNAVNLQGVACIKLSETEYVNGLILLPDSWTGVEGVTFKSGFSSTFSVQAYANYQTFTLAEWQKLEAAGAVFLPAAGRRVGTGVGGVQRVGSYWSATPDDTDHAWYLNFFSDGAETLGFSRSYGQAVRLVQDVVYNITIATATNGKIEADKTAAAAGDTITLTVTPETGYEVEKITVTYGENQTVEVTANTFTMPAGAVTVTATFKEQTTTPIVSNFTPAAFTVSAEGKQIYFSQGNLQCTLSATDTTWAFAANQYDMIGTRNVTGFKKESDATMGDSKSGLALTTKIDLFGWSAKNTTAPWGISTSYVFSDYRGKFVDWGKNIGDGNTWRTLTKAEWDYLLKDRTNADNLKGVARIKLNNDGSQYANGLILLPDSWTGVEGVTFTNGFSSDCSVQAYADYQTFTLADWQKLEAAGAVFLPAAGFRGGTHVYRVQGGGYYWSATPDGSNDAYDLYFYSNGAYTDCNTRDTGLAVRLVQDLD